MLKGELEHKGFMVKYRITQTEFSIYGKSLQDFYFYREFDKIGMKNGTVHAGMLLLNSDEEDVEIESCITDLFEAHIEGATTEFKMEKGDTRFLP